MSSWEVWVLLSAMALAVPSTAGQRMLPGISVGPSGELDRIRQWLRSAGRPRRRGPVEGGSLTWAMAIAGDLRAGVEPNEALTRACDRTGVAGRAAAAARVGGRVDEELLQEADLADDVLLRSVAACWAVGGSTGAALAGILEGICDGHRESGRIRQELEVDLAGPRTTARLMTLLPVVGLLFAWLLGANPVAWLFGTGPGWLALVLGTGLNLLGALWTRRLVRESAEFW